MRRRVRGTSGPDGSTQAAETTTLNAFIIQRLNPKLERAGSLSDNGGTETLGTTRTLADVTTDLRAGIFLQNIAATRANAAAQRGDVRNKDALFLSNGRTENKKTIITEASCLPPKRRRNEVLQEERVGGLFFFFGVD